MCVDRIIAGLLVIASFAGNASADALKQAASQVTDCRSIEGDAARLQCLDFAASNLALILTESAVDNEASEPKWAQAPQEREVKQDENNRAPIWARVLRDDDGSDDELLPVTVVRITRNKTGRMFFYTESGQIWRQTKKREFEPPTGLPAEAVIQKSITGSPRLSFDEKPDRSYRVRRVE